MKKLIPLAAALALLMQASAEDRSPAEQLGWTLAVHSYTFQKFPIFEAIDKTAAVGAKHMSISGSVNLPGADGKFKPSSTIGLALKDAAVISARMKEKGLDTTFVNMCVVEKLAKEYNIKVATHNHPGPKNFYWKPDTVAAAVKGSSGLLDSCADVGHWVRSGLDPVECLKRLEGRVIALHFKDLNERSPKAHDVQWGTGVSNTKGMLVELQRQKFRGAFCVEYEINWENSSPEIAKCVEWFNNTCSELVSTGK